MPDSKYIYNYIFNKSTNTKYIPSIKTLHINAAERNELL